MSRLGQRLIAAMKSVLSCDHSYSSWTPVKCSDDTIVGQKRVCEVCSQTEYDMYPDGH